MFFVITLLIPALFFVLLEMGLRLGGYGGELDLVYRRTIGSHEFFSINRSVAARYFAHAGTTIPEPADETFAIKKPPTTKRIFCIGESTMAGYPFEFHATAPSFLRDRLQAEYPQYTFEVINVGLSAVGSFVILDFLRELVNYEPDLIIVYSGHNEFYGAYGVASTVSVGGAWLTDLHIRLLKIKTTLLVRDVLAAIKALFVRNGPVPTGTMMQQMAAHQTIPFNSTLYATAKQIFADNIAGMIITARDNHIPIMFSSLVSNLKDQSPFVPIFNEATTPGKQNEWHALVERGKKALAARDFLAAEEHLRNAIGIDSSQADGFFLLGRTLYASGNFADALTMFAKAKDLDALRFRATEEFQNILTDITTRHGVPLARVDSAFAAHSDGGITGEELILEHLHPSIDGYFLMAKVFAAEITSAGILLSRDEASNRVPVSDSTLFDLSTVSEFDYTVGRLKVEFLKRRWPFNKGTTNFEFTPANVVESLAFQYAQQKIAWSDARYKLAEYYAGEKQFALARRECRAVSKVIPFSYNPLLRIADYYLMEGKRDEARHAFAECLRVEDNPYAHIKLGIMLLEEVRPADAAVEFEAALSVNATFQEPLIPEAASAARYLLAASYANSGRLNEAVREAQLALAINPRNEDAADLISQIQAKRNPDRK